MGIHIQPQVSDFTIYFYDNGKFYDQRDKYRAVITGSIKTGSAHGIELHGLCGNLEPGDTDDLVKALKARGFEQVWVEVHKDVQPNQLFAVVDELEQTNIYYCDLREF